MGSWNIWISMKGLSPIPYIVTCLGFDPGIICNRSWLDQHKNTSRNIWIQSAYFNEVKVKSKGGEMERERQQNLAHHCQYKGIIAVMAFGDGSAVIISVINKIVLIHLFYVSGKLLWVEKNLCFKKIYPSFCHILNVNFYKRLHISLLAKSYNECRKCLVKVVNAVDAILEEHPNRLWHDPRSAQ